MQRTFELEHRVNHPLEMVRDALIDLTEFGRYHPLMERVDKIDDNNFMIFEFYQLPFGLKMRFSYAARLVRGPDANHIRYEANPQGMGIVLNFRLHYDSAQKITTVNEEVLVSGFRLLVGTLEKAIRQSHTALFAKMAAG